jgi:hypothetical protein
LIAPLARLVGGRERLFDGGARVRDFFTSWTPYFFFGFFFSFFGLLSLATE